MVAQVFSRPCVLQVPWLLLDRGNFAQCKGLWASPPPLSWAPWRETGDPFAPWLTAVLGVRSSPREGMAPGKTALALRH